MPKWQCACGTRRTMAGTFRSMGKLYCEQGHELRKLAETARDKERRRARRN